MLLSMYFLATMIVVGTGLAAFFAALQVYFGDTSSFLPFFVRIWMYPCPICGHQNTSSADSQGRS